MASRPGLSAASVTGIGSPYASRRSQRLWGAAALVGASYGVFLVVTAAGLPDGAALTGRFTLQPGVKALTAVLLAAVALGHPVRRERRWLVAALIGSAVGDFLLAMPWWKPSFVLGLGAFLVAHLCFLTALLPLAVAGFRTPGAGRPGLRIAAALATVAACVTLLTWFWPGLLEQGMVLPVTVYMVVLAAMVCAALLADLPSPWTALGALSFAVSDAMIGIDQFVLHSEALAVPIWWAYAASLLSITAGFFVGRHRCVAASSPPGVSERPATPGV